MVASVAAGFAAPTAAQAACSDVEVVFARGSSELPGLGLAGGPFADAVKSNLPGKSVSTYAVNYPADVLQLSGGEGSIDMTNHVTQTAASCPNTRFVLGGYSQGATVVDKSIGINILIGGTGKTIPNDLAPRVAAVVVFGNPLGIFLQHIPTSSQLYGPKAKEFCNDGDPVCLNGANILAHLSYGIDGSAADGGKFAADKVKALTT